MSAAFRGGSNADLLRAFALIPVNDYRTVTLARVDRAYSEVRVVVSESVYN